MGIAFFLPSNLVEDTKMLIFGHLFTKDTNMNKPVRIQSFQFLDGSWLKIIAMVTMVLDHIAVHLMKNNPVYYEPFFSIGNHHLMPYYLLHNIGRLAFPIFAFLIVEGFIHTHNRVKYGRNLLLFAFISEIPWNLVFSNTLYYHHQNVMFTLFFGFLALCAIEYYKNDTPKLALSLIVLFIVAYNFKADFGYKGFGFIVLLYALRHTKVVQAILGCCLLPSDWLGGLAFIPINMYNGKRGFIQGKWGKYFFYAFYPAHLFILYLIKWC